MARGLLYFAFIFLVFMFAQMAVLIWRVLATSPGLAPNGFSLALLDTPGFQERWQELSANGDVLSWVGLLSGVVGLLLVFTMTGRWKRGETRAFLAMRPAATRTWFIWFGMFIVLFSALEGLSFLLPGMDSEFMKQVLASVTDRPLMILGLAVVPALFEEFLLRGLMYGSLRHVLDKHVAIAIVAGVFTLVHQQYDWYILLLYVLPFGVFLGYARANTGSIWVGVVLHMLNNMASLLWPF